MDKVLPFHRFSGTHLQIGRQYGEACRDLIRGNLGLSLQRVCERTKATREQALRAALEYRPFILRHAPFLDEEIQGIAEASGLSREEVYYLQLRAEIHTAFSQSRDGVSEMECTTFALSPFGTVDRKPLAGQNADLPSFYSEVCVVVEISAPGKPGVLMLTPAGQVSYIGMNRAGLCVFANYLVCDGWRVGYPRYCLTRLALTRETVSEAEQALLEVPRASSRNVLMIDARGEILDLEFAVQRHGRLHLESGRFVHSNHILAREIQDEERAPEEDLDNSRLRRERLEQLIDERYGGLDAAAMQACLRDRQTYPDPLCIEPGDRQHGDESTIASVIAEPARMCLWAAVGPPSWHSYARYAFSS